MVVEGFTNSVREPLVEIDEEEKVWMVVSSSQWFTTNNIKDSESFQTGERKVTVDVM